MEQTVYEKTIRKKRPFARLSCTLEKNCWAIWLVDDSGGYLLDYFLEPNNPTVKNNAIERAVALGRKRYPTLKKMALKNKERKKKGGV